MGIDPQRIIQTERPPRIIPSKSRQPDPDLLRGCMILSCPRLVTRFNSRQTLLQQNILVTSEYPDGALRDPFNKPDQAFHSLRDGVRIHIFTQCMRAPAGCDSHHNSGDRLAQRNIRISRTGCQRRIDTLFLHANYRL